MRFIFALSFLFFHTDHGSSCQSRVIGLVVSVGHELRALFGVLGVYPVQYRRSITSGIHPLQMGWMAPAPDANDAEGGTPFLRLDSPHHGRSGRCVVEGFRFRHLMSFGTGSGADAFRM